MLVKAKASFAGKISMIRGKIRDITDEEVVNDLLRAGYVELIEPDEQPNDGENADLPDEQPNDGENADSPDEQPNNDDKADSAGDKPKRKRRANEGK